MKTPKRGISRNEPIEANVRATKTMEIAKQIRKELEKLADDFATWSMDAHAQLTCKAADIEKMVNEVLAHGAPQPEKVSSCEWAGELESELRKAIVHYKHELKTGGPNYKSEYRRGWRDAVKMLITKRTQPPR